MTRRGRGRPRHPEILTPAEQRVLNELRRGGTNAEIAARLGVTLDAVKYHISNMLGKLELDNREQLAAWRPERRRLFGLLAVPAALESLGRPLLWTGATLAGAAVVAVVVVVLLVLSTLDDSEEQSPIPPPDMAVQVSASGSSACAVRDSGRLICWPGYWIAVPQDGTYRSVSVGSGRACAIEASGTVACWAAQVPLPQSAPPGLYRSVSVGNSHACAVRDSGEVVCWWDGEHGKADAPPGSFRAVSAGTYHTCGLRESGEIACWGGTEDGEADAPPGQYHAVSAGDGYTCALRESGEAMCWGRNDQGQLDAPPGPFQSLSAGRNHACALRESGELTCWSDIENDPPPGRFRSVSAGSGQTCAIAHAGGTVCWRTYKSGTLTPPPGQYRALSAGYQFACAIRKSGEIDCWGSYATDPRSRNEAQPPPGKYRSVSVGDLHACAVEDSGEVACWGFFASEPEYIPEGPFRSVSAGLIHACAVRNSGEVECWGLVGGWEWCPVCDFPIEEDYGQAEPPPGHVPRGKRGRWAHTCAIRTVRGDRLLGRIRYPRNSPVPRPGRFRSVSTGRHVTTVPFANPARSSVGGSSTPSQVRRRERIVYVSTSGRHSAGHWLERSRERAPCLRPPVSPVEIDCWLSHADQVDDTRRGATAR